LVAWAKSKREGLLRVYPQGKQKAEMSTTLIYIPLTLSLPTLLNAINQTLTNQNSSSIPISESNTHKVFFSRLREKSYVWGKMLILGVHKTQSYNYISQEVTVAKHSILFFK
jgi:hypothetical protein